MHQFLYRFFLSLEGPGGLSLKKEYAADCDVFSEIDDEGKETWYVNINSVGEIYNDKFVENMVIYSLVAKHQGFHDAVFWTFKLTRMGVISSEERKV